MTLLEQLREIKEKLTRSRTDIVAAIREKGVTVEDEILISEMANAIRLIFQSNFDFLFDFRSIDQFGNPHVPNTGNATSGMTGMDQSFVFVQPIEFDFYEKIIQDSVDNLRGAFGVGTVGFNPSFDLEVSMDVLAEFHNSKEQ